MVEERSCADHHLRGCEMLFSACCSCTERSACSAGSAEVGWLDARCPHVTESHPSQLHVDLYSNTSVRSLHFVQCQKIQQ